MMLLPNAKSPVEDARAFAVTPPKRRSNAHHITTVEELIAAVTNAQCLKLITIKDVCERTGTGASFVYAEAAAGRFPRAVKLGASKNRRAAARFVESEVSDWIEQRIAERDALTERAADEKEPL